MHLAQLVFVVLTPSTWLSGCSSKADLKYMTTPELIRYWGYEVQIHTIRTDDDYLLTMHRIPSANSTYYPVIVQHGILMASDTWVLRGPKEDLVLLLADRGFDIWLANTRGNPYSKKHLIYTRFEKRYWNFGWDELGQYDIPAMIRYIRQVTGRSQVIHIGHSMGTTSFYAMLSKQPKMNNMIAAHISLAPVAYVGRMKSLEVLHPVITSIYSLLKLQNSLRLFDLFARDKRISLLVFKICNVSKRNRRLCYRLLFYFVGSDYQQLRAEYFDRLVGHIPSGASAGMFLHYAQNALSGEFREFNFGPMLNLEKYGSLQAPIYNLSSITTPIYLYYGANDYLSNILDVEKLAKRLPNVKKYLVPYKDFNHLDFIFAVDSTKLLYEDIIRTLKIFIIPQ